MKTNRFFMAMSLYVVLLVAACASSTATVPTIPEGAKAGDLTGMKECEYQPADSKMKYTAVCGTLAVPENWDKANEGLIALPVVRIPAKVANPAEPVFYLQGGPGQSNFSWAPPDWLFENHDVVFVGYRGLDGTVTLACPVMNRLMKTHAGKDAFSDSAHKEYAAAIRQCAARFQKEGVDLSGYTIPGVIQDLEAARVAL